MFKYILESAGNINWMAIAALLTFVTVFVLSAILVWRRDPAFIQKMASMPLDDASNYSTPETEDHHEK